MELKVCFIFVDGSYESGDQDFSYFYFFFHFKNAASAVRRPAYGFMFTNAHRLSAISDTQSSGQIEYMPCYKSCLLTDNILYKRTKLTAACPDMSGFTAFI